MKVKVKVFQYPYGTFFADIYADDVSEIAKAINEFKQKMKQLIPFITDVSIETEIFTDYNTVSENEMLKEKKIGHIESDAFDVSTLDEFINRISKILKEKSIEYTIEVN